MPRRERPLCLRWMHDHPRQANLDPDLPRSPRNSPKKRVSCEMPLKPVCMTTAKCPSQTFLRPVPIQYIIKKDEIDVKTNVLISLIKKNLPLVMTDEFRLRRMRASYSRVPPQSDFGH
jgi:hypothetical protein